MIVRVSIPSLPSACACSSACSITAPQKDQEYGTTIPTFTALRIRRYAECLFEMEELVRVEASRIHSDE